MTHRCAGTCRKKGSEFNECADREEAYSRSVIPQPCALAWLVWESGFKLQQGTHRRP